MALQADALDKLLRHHVAGTEQNLFEHWQVDHKVEQGDGPRSSEPAS